MVDAFVGGAARGNRAGVVLLAGAIDEAAMRAEAAAAGLPAIAYVEPEAGEGTRAIRWFGPAGEIALCGHAALAAAHVLLAAAPAGTTLHFETRSAGRIAAWRNGRRCAIALPVIRPVPAPLDAVVAALGAARVHATLIDPRGYAVVVLADAAAVRALRPDFAALADAGPFSVAVTAAAGKRRIVSRVFVPAFGIDEDQVTGSAHAALASYWSDRMGPGPLCARQASHHGGVLRCRSDDAQVVLEGRCTTD